MLKIVVSKFVFTTRIVWLESFVRNQTRFVNLIIPYDTHSLGINFLLDIYMLIYLYINSLMEQNQAEEIMEYALLGVVETPIVHLGKSASTLVPLVEQEKKR